MTISVPRTRAEVRQQLLDDIEGDLREQGYTDPPVQRGTDLWVRANATASMAVVAFASAEHEAAQATYWGATEPERIEQHRRALGTPEAPALGSAGRLIISVPNGTVALDQTREFTTPGGKRGRVVGTWPLVADGDEVEVETIDTGSDTTAAGGTVVAFVDPPLGMSARAVVSYIVPLTGGRNVETPQETQQRISERMKRPPSAGNWPHLRELAKGAGVTVEDVFIYPALGGPSSVKIVPTKRIIPALNDWSRAHDSGALDKIRRHVHAQVGYDVEVVVQAPNENNEDCALFLQLQPAPSAGGDGSGWVDISPWPSLAAGGTSVAVTSVTSELVFVCNCQLSNSPAPNTTKLAWWSPHDQRFHVFRVTYYTGSSGAWTITVDRPMVDTLGNGVTAGDLISPACANLEAYGNTWRGIMGRLAPYENSASSARAARRPSDAMGSFGRMSDALHRQLKEAHTEVEATSYALTSPTAPASPVSVATAPAILVLRHFAVYPSL
jgi:hypothetical protein